MKLFLRYRVLLITAFFLLFGLGASLLAKASELKLSYLLLSPLLALAVSSLLLFLLRGKLGRRLSPVLRPVAFVNFALLLLALIFYVSLFNRSTFKFLHGDGSITNHIKGDKACYSDAAKDCQKENPGISDDDMIALCFTNPANKTWVWSEDCIKKNLVWLIAVYAVVVILVSAFFSFLAEYFAQKRRAANAMFPSPFFDEEETTVFLSYSHTDKAIADTLKAMLEKEKIKVVIDSEAMRAGDDISAFVYSSILQSQVTLAVVSPESLLSSWVGLETMSTFFLQKFSKDKHFIACSLNDEIFAPGFLQKAVQSIDAKLATINASISQQDALKIDTRNLNEEKSRLIQLRNNLDEIINRLQNCLRVDISGNKLIENFPFLLKSIQEYTSAEATEVG